MKLQALQQSYANRGRNNNSFRGGQSPLDSSLSVDGTVTGNAVKSPAASVFWLILHCFCCLISLVLGFRFSRLVFFLLFSTSSINNITTSFGTASDIAETLSLSPPQAEAEAFGNASTVAAATASRVVVGRHGIRIRPWPHPDVTEVMRAHKIIEAVQREQRVQYGVKSPRTVIAITPTYVRTFQALHLTGLMHTLMNLPYDVVWIVVEAGGGATNETAALLAKSKVRVKHVGFEKKMPIFWEARHKMEAQMRLRGLRVVREEKLDGIVMFADDSNMHSLELFDEIQKVEWMGAVSVGILAHSARSDDDPFEVQKTVDEKDDKKSESESESPLPVQGPACNSSDQLIGWHTFNSGVYKGKSANYIGDMAVVLPRKLEWSGFVMNSRLVWKEAEFRPDWIKDLDTVIAGDGDDDIESPLSLLKDASMVEPLGSCGKKVMLWWLRAEARADSKFPSGWTIDPPLDVTIPAKRTPWPDAPLELPSNTEKTTTTVTQETVTEKRATKTRTPRSRRTSRGKRKRESRNADARRNPGERIVR